MVTGAGDVVDRVVGLEVGADDYVAQALRSARAAGAGEERAAPRRAESTRAQRRLRPPRAASASALPARPRLAPAVRARAATRSPLTAMEFDLLRDLPRPPEPGAVARPAPHPHPQPRMGALRPLDRHPHRAACGARSRTTRTGRAPSGPSAARATCTSRGNVTGLFQWLPTGNHPSARRAVRLHCRP